MIPLSTAVNIKDVPATFSALSISPRPKNIDIRLAEPIPTSMPIPAARFITGKIIPAPLSASRPIQWPIKIPSIMLYSVFTVVPIIDGSAYCQNNKLIFLCLKSS